MARDYYIAFNTEDKPLIRATRVSLGTELVRDDKTVFKINLCDDPLYPALVEYVKANPARDKSK